MIAFARPTRPLALVLVINRPEYNQRRMGPTTPDPPEGFMLSSTRHWPAVSNALVATIESIWIQGRTYADLLAHREGCGLLERQAARG